MTTWQVQEAKQRFSEVLRAAERGQPQFVTKHGKPVAVLIDIDDYRKAHLDDRRYVDFLLSGPVTVGLEAELELPERLSASPDESEADEVTK